MPKDDLYPWRDCLAHYLPEEPGNEDLVRFAGSWLLEDLAVARHSLLLELLAGSTLTPRLVRWWIYRRAGLDINTPNIHDHCVFRVGGVSIAPRSGLGAGCRLEGLGSVTIGRNCMIGFGTTFITSHHPTAEDGTVQKRPVGRPIVVGEHVWIGAKSVITPGAVIGDHCTIAAGSVVAGHLEGGYVYAGVPARPIKPQTPAMPG